MYYKNKYISRILYYTRIYSRVGYHAMQPLLKIPDSPEYWNGYEDGIDRHDNNYDGGGNGGELMHGVHALDLSKPLIAIHLRHDETDIPIHQLPSI